MNPQPLDQGPGGFEFTPEVGLLVLGILATLLLVAVFAWLLRGMIREDARDRAAEEEEARKKSARSDHEPE